MKRVAASRLVANQQGATIVLVAVSLVTLITCAAIAIDLGMLLNSRSEAQRVADAAALAGASVFEEDGVEDLSDDALRDKVHERVHLYGELNNVLGEPVQPAEMAIEIVRPRGLVRVTVTRAEIPLWFARIFGLNTSTVAARAAAAVQYSATVECLRPLAFADFWQEQNAGNKNKFTLSAPYQFFTCALGGAGCDYYDPKVTGVQTAWRNPGQPGHRAGSTKMNDVGRQMTFVINRTSIDADAVERLDSTTFYPYRLGTCTGVDCFRDLIAGENCDNYGTIDGPVVTEPGNYQVPIRQGLERGKARDPNARWDEAADTIVNSLFPNDCGGEVACSPRVFNVGLVHPSSRLLANGSDSYPIQNLASFFVEDFWLTGSPPVLYIQVRWMTPPKPIADDCWEKGTCRSNLRLPLRLIE